MKLHLHGNTPSPAYWTPERQNKGPTGKVAFSHSTKLKAVADLATSSTAANTTKHTLLNVQQVNPSLLLTLIPAVQRLTPNTKHTLLDVQEEGVSIAAAAMKEAQGLATEKERRLLAVTQKQDKLLYLCAYLLLNLSEDPDIERKMQKKVCCWAGVGMGYVSGLRV